MFFVNVLKQVCHHTEILSGLIVLLFSLYACSTPSESNFSTAVEIVVTSNNPEELARVIEQAKPLLASGRDVNVSLAAGTYYLDKTLVLENNTDNTLSLIGAMDGKTIISGAKKTNPKWQRHTQNIVKTKLDIHHVDQVFVGDKSQIRARYPNYNPNADIYGGYAEDAIDPKRTKHWTNPKGAFVHALHKGRWGGMHYALTGKAADGEWILEGGYQNNRPSAPHRKYRYVENVFEELDAPKEWYFDNSDQTLYFYPDSTDLANYRQLDIPQLKQLITITGNANKPVKNIMISGITFTHTTHSFMDTSEPLLRSDWAIYRGAAVAIENAENIQIKASSFVNLGGNAIAVNRYARNIEISGNHISHIGAGAINFVGDPSAVRSASFTYHEFIELDKIDFSAGPQNALYPANSLVIDNLIHNIGLIEKQVAGVQLSMSRAITVSHNSIYQVPRAGINVSEGTWGGHLIEYNDVFNTVLETGDHGAFNSWGRDRFWHPTRKKMEYITQSYPDLYLKDATETVVIRNNRFRCDHGWDIDLDDGSSNYDIYNNVLLNGGLKLREGFRRNVYNNILINNTLHPHVWFKNSGDKFKHNIVMMGYAPVSNDFWGEDIDQNYFMNWSALDDAQKRGTDKRSKYGPPLFINANTGDFRVQDDSKAKEIGFKNFSTNNVGVMSPKLKKIALKPNIPGLILANQSNDKTKTYQLFGAKIKTVTTLGEQSALGISEMAGAMIISVTKDSLMDRSGIMANDVILEVLDKNKIDTAEDFLSAYQTNKWHKKLNLTISRNQNIKKIILLLRD
ncbi:PDZ domain-containing protein [Zhongshania borealis]|uniref:PDZ domain-containing protein n=1 Tax=Zhongshania borealis TaxID=889488 RepID=A0ABP7WRI9_9GAMM